MVDAKLFEYDENSSSCFICGQKTLQPNIVKTSDGRSFCICSNKSCDIELKCVLERRSKKEY